MYLMNCKIPHSFYDADKSGTPPRCRKTWRSLNSTQLSLACQWQTWSVGDPSAMPATKCLLRMMSQVMPATLWCLRQCRRHDADTWEPGLTIKMLTRFHINNNVGCCWPSFWLISRMTLYHNRNIIVYKNSQRNYSHIHCAGSRTSSFLYSNIIYNIMIFFWTQYYWLTHWFTCSHSLTDWLIDWIINLSGFLIDWLIDLSSSLIDWLIDWLQ